MKIKIFTTLAFIAFNFLFCQKGYYERLITDEGGVLKPGQPVIINGNSGTFTVSYTHLTLPTKA